MRRRVEGLLLLSLVLVAGGAGRGAAEQTERSRRVPDVPNILRVCADPAGLPFSNAQGLGFENRIAELLAEELGAKLQYTWWVQRRGFLRHTLGAGACDVVIGVPAGLRSVRTTRPYYRSTFAFLTRKARGLGDLQSLGDPRLRTLEIGVPLAGDEGGNPGPVLALGRRGLANNLRGFPLYAELGRTLPAAAEAVATGEIAVALLWGPVAGAAAKESREPLVATPVSEASDGDVPLAYAMALGVRKDDAAFAERLDAALLRRRPAITALLRNAGVPLLPLEDTSRGDRDARR